MTETAAKTYTDFTLPPTVVSKLDVSRMVSDAERVDSQLTTTAVRSKIGTTSGETLAASQQLIDFLRLNQLRLDGDSNARSQLVKQLRLMKDNVPVIHMTFAVEADRESLGQIVDWLRSSVHPQAVISVGLQPALVAGVYMRLPNHVLDLSLRAKLQSSHDMLVKELEATRG